MLLIRDQLSIRYSCICSVKFNMKMYLSETCGFNSSLIFCIYFNGGIMIVSAVTVSGLIAPLTSWQFPPGHTSQVSWLQPDNENSLPPNEDFSCRPLGLSLQV